MALTQTPVHWSTQTLITARAKTVYGAPGVTNRNFQGEISGPGDRVRVVGISDPTIFDVTPNTDIPGPETLGDTGAELVIDQSKGFNFQVDDLDQIQKQAGRGLVLQSAVNAGAKIALAADAVIATKMIAAVPSANTLGSTGSPKAIDAPLPGVQPANGSTYAYNILVGLSIKMDKALIPQDGRWVVVPSFMRGALGLDPRFIASADGGATLRNGFAGRVAGFDVYVATTVPVSAGKYSVVAGVSQATSYAEQLTKVEFYRPQLRFADAAKGLHVFGAKVFYPNFLAMAIVTDVSGLDG